jgi:hypothetical protein
MISGTTHLDLAEYGWLPIGACPATCSKLEEEHTIVEGFVRKLCPFNRVIESLLKTDSAARNTRKSGRRRKRAG